uniref:interleukin-1 receptor-associated kinase-like 2 isoform X1 n=1 Tax=Jaculus jaculus TaxID=51337 RepID=UPI001E1B5F28|nr:interleukin-1 receptor-associated kinase-like 2 isoform X1 [Jaculus jaculus]
MDFYIYQLPSWVLEDLCRNMDTLSEWDWMQFASYVITDLTQLRKIKSMERVQGVSITRELLWWWAMRQATVQQLVDLLCHLELYRAAQIILSWFTTARAQEQALNSLLYKETPCSLKTNLPTLSTSKDFSIALPKQENLLSVPGDRLLWNEADVVQATDNFDQSHRICAGTFADIYRGQRHGVPFVFKKLREPVCSSPVSVDRFLQVEMQLCLRGSHRNILPLLGLCAGRQFHSLIYPYMANGSLKDRLQTLGGSDPLTWPLRVSICAGLLSAVKHLHGLEIVHSNIKSSNILLDQNFTPKLAHPVAHLHPVDKRSKYTMMNTHLFQASAAYLPENFIRVGQLDKQVDVFSCGIVLAEVLTGIPAVDKDRSPVYLKDLLLKEIPGSTALLCSRKMGMEKMVVKEICQNLVEKQSGPLPEVCAKAWATAVCLCLRRRNASLEEACEAMAVVEERLRGQLSLPWSGLAEGTVSNTPEETDDVDNSRLATTSSVKTASYSRAVSVPLPTSSEVGLLLARGESEPDWHLQVCTGMQLPRDETSWKIEINEAKRKLMENILLYTEEKLDSIELFGP